MRAAVKGIDQRADLPADPVCSALGSYVCGFDRELPRACNVEYRRHPEDLLIARPGGLSARNKETDG
jgi:hypothetical protein